MTILVVDDEPEVLRYVRDVLRAAGYATLSTGDHRELPGLIRAEKPHLVLLDLMLPGTDGIKLMEQVPELADLPVVFISAYGRDETVARALEAGAADYIVKPFSPTELTARVRASLRSRAGPARFELGALSIDYGSRRVTVSGRPVRLTATEYEVLRVLSKNAGRVSTYRSLLRQAWSRHPGPVNPKLVHAVVQTLRRKLGEDGFPGGLDSERARAQIPHACAVTCYRNRPPAPPSCRSRSDTAPAGPSVPTPSGFSYVACSDAPPTANIFDCPDQGPAFSRSPAN